MKQPLTLLFATFTMWHAFAADPDAALTMMRTLNKERKWNELVAQFKDENVRAWKDASAKTGAIDDPIEIRLRHSDNCAASAYRRCP
ncbi:MAG: hypothetical protein KA257_14230 [Opitutaceae bacterium]|nr:hypothetical protein [Opitutaceae bacterium]